MNSKDNLEPTITMSSPIETRLHCIRDEVNNLTEAIARMRARTEPIRYISPTSPAQSSVPSPTTCQLDEVLSLIETQIVQNRQLIHSTIDEFQI